MTPPTLRAQYHFRQSESGLLAWDVRTLVRLTRDHPVRELAVADIAELDANHWYAHAVPTCRSILEHLQLVQDADLSFPIILDQAGRVMDGMHRVCKAAMLGLETIPAVQFTTDPPPDHIDRHPDSLPYDDGTVIAPGGAPSP